jgi:hypothetical protein
MGHHFNETTTCMGSDIINYYLLTKLVQKSGQFFLRMSFSF